MKLSAKGQHALTTMTYLALRHETAEPVPGPAIAAHIGVSKLYLEQVLALLRRAGLISSVKGAHGGYLLSLEPGRVTVADILTVAEPDLFTPVKEKGSQDSLLAAVIEKRVYHELDRAIRDRLASVTLLDLALAYNRMADEAGHMFYI